MNLETTRRRFIQLAAAALSGAATTVDAVPSRCDGYVEIKVDPTEKWTNDPGVIWAIGQLLSSLRSRDIVTRGSGEAVATVVIAPFDSALTKGFHLPEAREPEM